MSDIEAAFVEEGDPAAEFLAREQSNFSEIDSISGFSELPSTDTIQVNNGDIEPQIFSDSPDLQNELDPAPILMNGHASQFVEPEKLRKWREEQQERLAKKDKESEEKAAVMMADGKRELEEWNNKRKEHLKKTKVNNREAEQEFLKESESTEPGDEWQKIARYCEFNPKTNKNTKDVSHIRSVLLQLKQTRPAAKVKG